MSDWLITILWSAGGIIGIPILLKLWTKFVPRKTVYMFAFKLGRLLTNWGDLKFGKQQWEKAENGVIALFYDFSDGFRDGSRPEEKPEPTPPEG